MSSTEFKLHDPVKVDQKSTSQPLRGIVAYLGSVEFSDGDDWIGVRLIGASVGKGKNDGTVHGKKYFDVSSGPGGDLGGVFVRASHVYKVELTKLEALRLKRELSSGGASVGGGSTSSSAASRRRATAVSANSNSPRNKDDDDTSVSSMRSSSTSASNRSRLDEIRQRRIELQRNKNKLISPPPKNIIATKSVAAAGTTSKTPSRSTSTPGRSPAPSSSGGTSKTPIRKPITSDSAPRSSAKKSVISPKAGKSATTPTSRSKSTITAAASSSPKSKSTSPTSTPARTRTRNTNPASTPTSSSSSFKKPPTSPTSRSQSPSPKSKSSTTTTTNNSVELNHLHEKIKILEQHLQSKDKELNDAVESLTEQIHIKDHKSMAMKSEMQSFLHQLDEKERQNKKLNEALRSAEQTAHEAQLAVEESKAELEEWRRKMEQEAEARAVEHGGSPGAEVEVDEGVVAELKVQVADLLATNEILSRDKLGLEDTLTTSQRENSTLRHELERERESHSETVQLLRKEITEAKSHASVLENELSQTVEKKALRDDNNASHYKERAKLQAEVLSWQRKVEEMARDKVDIESALEELTLDKESLLEKNEELEDKYEEIKIDAESAQIEVDELRLELEEARERLEKVQAAESLGAAGGGNSGGGTSSDADQDEVMQALSVQNGRLREAIIRLREQTSLEKMEFAKQLRAAEKDSSLATSLKVQVEKLESFKKAFKEEIKELKDMVDQGAAFEGMVEDLSERVLLVEDNNITLQSTIREMEEGAELSAEMEEAQAEEIKMLMLELQNRDTVVINLEQAIKMQRRRELDFQRTVGNYRVTIETLQKEKQSLLEEMGGSDGVKEDAIVASQKALAQAAESVAEATAARKKEAEASFNLIDAQVKSHLAERLEDFLPQGIASSEISAVKGELLLSKIAMKASLSLSSIRGIFEKKIGQAKAVLHDISSAVGASEKLSISNALSHEIGTMVHQTKFCRVAIEVSVECLCLLAAGQWPALMSSEASMDFGTLIAHTVPELDSAISEQLLLLKKEGSLSPHQSNLNILTQSLTSTCSALKTAVDSSGSPLIPPKWSPPSLRALQLISMSKFDCFGAAAVLSRIIADSSDKTQNGAYMLKDSMTKVSAFCNEMATICSTIAEVDLNDDIISENITSLAINVRTSTSDLFTAVETLFVSQEILSSEVIDLDASFSSTTNALSKLNSFIRSHQTSSARKNESPLLSPETIDPWTSVVEAARTAQRSSADIEPLNYIVRGRNLEEQLSLAVENDAKLSIAEAKVKSLEKTLATRSKEISLQNSRLQELETILSQAPERADPSSPQKPKAAPEEISKLKEEIRVLNEAMEVVQSQVEEYEREIRSLKDQKSRSSRLPGSARKGASLETDFSLASLGIGSPQKIRQDSSRSQLSLESALFRPALRSALSDASMWKSKFISDKLVQLPPLQSLSSDNKADLLSQKRQLMLACAKVRNAKASVGIIKLAGTSSPRSLLVEERKKAAVAFQRLESVSDTTRFSIAARVA